MMDSPYRLPVLRLPKIPYGRLGKNSNVCIGFVYNGTSAYAASSKLIFRNLNKGLGLNRAFA